MMFAELSPERVAYEAAIRDELFAEARAMTDLGMAGADLRDPRTYEFLTTAINATGDDTDALKAHIKRFWR